MPQSGYQDPNSDNLYSSRKEDKYICNLKDLDSIIEEVEYYLDPYYPTKDTDYVVITSTYMDTPDLKFLDQHLSGGDRKKIRLRTYAPNGKRQDKKYLEIKYKVNNHKMKARICVDALALAQAIGGQDLPPGTRKLNKEISKDDYEEGTKLIKDACKPGLSPTLGVKYTRLSYEGGGIRVTIDKDIIPSSCAVLKDYDPSKVKDSPRWSILEQIGCAYVPSKNIVVEIKYPEGEVPPKWISKLLAKYADKQSTFSKYVYGIYQELV